MVALCVLALAGGAALAMEWLQKGSVPLPRDSGAGVDAGSEAASPGAATATAPEAAAARATADGTEEAAPVPARELVAQSPPPITAASLAGTGLPEGAAADLATALLDLQQVSATGGGSARLRDRIALVLAIAPDLAARIADRSVVVKVERRSAPVDAVTSAFEVGAPDRRAPHVTMTVYGREHVLRVQITRAVGLDQLWQPLLDRR